jgi:hypothetical protein
MTITVETGAGLSNSDAFISVADCDSYHDLRGNTHWTGSTAHKEAAIRRATAYLSNSYTWAGLRTHGRSQALAFPRSGIYDKELYGIPSDEVPIEIVQATAEIALRELITPNAMTPDFIQSELVMKEKVGALEVTYANASLNADASRPILLIVRDLVSPFLAAGAGNSLVGSSYRA